MFKKIKEYFAEKRELRKLMLDTMKKANTIVTSAGLLMNTFVAYYDPEEFKQMIDNLNKIAQSPDLQTAYFQQVSAQAHAEKMAEKQDKGKN